MPATEARSDPAPNTRDREIVATRVFDAPRHIVWQMWSDPNHLDRWWGPRGFTTSTSEMEFRPGGVWKCVMHGPDGRDYPNKIVYREIVAPKLIVYSHVSGPMFDSTIQFTERAGKTEVSVRMLFETAAQRDKTAREFGAVEGLQQTLERLGERVAEQLQNASARFAKNDLVITRVLDAPRELVFKAWTEPKHLAAWWGPRGFTNPVCEADVRPGGAIRIDMRGPDGNIYPMRGTFDEIEAPKRLVFTTMAFEDKDGTPQLEVRNTVTFDDDRGKTRLTLEAHVVKAVGAAMGGLAGMEQGWNQSLDRLTDAVTTAASPAEFAITRTFDAGRDLVWKAWTESDRMAQWFGPKGATISHSKNDLRPGGIYHYGMRTPDGAEVWGKWTYREVVPPERLVFITSFSDEKGGITRHPLAPQWPLEMLSTILFEEADGKTTITVRWKPVNATTEEQTTFNAGRESMRGGWGGTFDQLEAYLAKA